MPDLLRTVTVPDVIDGRQEARKTFLAPSATLNFTRPTQVGTSSSRMKAPIG